MANDRQVQRRIGTAQNISKITKAMEMVAASKMKRAQEQAVKARPYAEALYESVKTVSEKTDPSLHQLLTKNDEGIPIVMVVGTDKGLCGNLNGQLTKQLSKWKENNPGGKVVAVGKKAVIFSRILDMEVVAQFSNISENITTADIVPISTLLINSFLDKTFRKVDVIYMDFINTLSQKTRMEQLMPLSVSSSHIDILGSAVDKKNSEPIMEDDKPMAMIDADYVFEPSPQYILQELLPFYFENNIFHIFLESMASEHSARMIAMKNASENAHELVDELKLIYNKSRQQSITNELLDITTATLTLR